VDALCFDDITEFGDEIDDPVEELIQDLYHRLIEEPGSNLDDLDRGYGISNMLSGPFDASMGYAIEAEFRKDDRVSDATVIVSEQETVGHYRVDIVVDYDDQKIGFAVTIDDNGVRRVI
jgi:hypothetical protein